MGIRCPLAERMMFIWIAKDRRGDEGRGPGQFDYWEALVVRQHFLSFLAVPINSVLFGLFFFGSEHLFRPTLRRKNEWRNKMMEPARAEMIRTGPAQA